MNEEPETWTFEVLNVNDLEIQTMGVIWQLVGRLDAEQASRVLDWAADRLRTEGVQP